MGLKCRAVLQVVALAVSFITKQQDPRLFMQPRITAEPFEGGSVV